MKFHIYSKNGTDFGIYEGDTSTAAWSEMVKDAGGTATDTDGNTAEGTIADWEIIPVQTISTDTAQGEEEQ